MTITQDWHDHPPDAAHADHDHPHPHSHEHDHGHDHDHPHDHDHKHGHDHSHPGGPLGWLLAVFHLHGHEHDEPDFGSDPGVATSEGIRTVWIALAVLGLTTLLQV